MGWLIAQLLVCWIAHTHLNDDTLAKHGEAVGDSAALAVVSAVQNLVDNIFKKMKEGSTKVATCRKCEELELS